MRGQRYTITINGKPIADLVPIVSQGGLDAAVAVEQMRKFMRSAPAVGGGNIKHLIDEGRP